MPILVFSYFTCVSRSGYLFPYIFALWLPSLQCVFLASLPSPPVIALRLPSFIFRLFLFPSPSLVFHPFPFLSVFVFMSTLLYLYPFFRGVKRNNGVVIIPSFLLKNCRYSFIPAQKFSLFHYSCSKIFFIPLFLPKSTHYSIIPRTKFPLFLFHYSSSAPEFSVSQGWVAMKIFMQSQYPYAVSQGRVAMKISMQSPVPICSVTGLSSHGDIYAIPSTDLQCDRAE